MALASDYVWALVAGLPSRDRERRLAMVYQAYIDDSGSEPQSPVMVLGGFVADHGQWAKFSDEWDAALKKPPGLAYFKMTEAAHLDGEFSEERGWTESKRNDRVITLARLIPKYVKARVAVAMPYHVFMKQIATLPAESRSLSTDTPYPFLFFQTIRLVAESRSKKLLNRRNRL